jgi:opacity protein-like surface antigen
MSGFSSRLALALLLTALCLGGRSAHAQAAPVSYWIPGWPMSFGGNLGGGQGASSYGNFPGFDGSSSIRTNFPNGWFVGGEGGGLGLNGSAPGMNGFNQYGALGSSLAYEGVQFGYDFKATRGLPLTVSAGFDTLKYNSGVGSAFAPFDSVSSNAGYHAHAGLEYQPTPNVSLSLGFGYTQQSSSRVDSDINSPLLPGASPVVNGLR